MLALPIDELALALLEELAGDQGFLNRRNWMLGVIQGGAHGNAHSPAIRAFSEAWAWLTAKGLVAPDPSQDGPDWVFVTRRGRAVLEAGLSELKATDRLDVELLPLLEGKARRFFLTGEYQHAVLEAMLQVEVRVRAMIGAPSSLVGVPLMRAAFGKEGVLRDPNANGGEQVATMELFAGAIGAFKNPSSHRLVEFDDPTHAAEIILLADLLMRILDRREVPVLIGAPVEGPLFPPPPKAGKRSSDAERSGTSPRPGTAPPGQGGPRLQSQLRIPGTHQPRHRTWAAHYLGRAASAFDRPTAPRLVAEWELASDPRGSTTAPQRHMAAIAPVELVRWCAC